MRRTRVETVYRFPLPHRVHAIGQRHTPSVDTQQPLSGDVANTTYERMRTA